MASIKIDLVLYSVTEFLRLSALLVDCLVKLSKQGQLKQGAQNDVQSDF